MPRTEGAFNKKDKWLVSTNDNEEEKFQSLSQVCERYNVDRSTIYRHIKDNNFTFGRHNKKEIYISKLV